MKNRNKINQYNTLMKRLFGFFDNGGDSVMMVMVADHGGLLALLPVPHQQHGDVLMEVLEKFKENYEDKMREK